MRFIDSLSEGDKFRVAHPNQVSLNHRKMPMGVEYVITKKFAQSPHYTIAVMQKKPKDGIYSLGPRTPVLLPRERVPSIQDILRFIGAKPRKVIVGYRVLWDGKTDLSGICAPQAAAIVKMMFALGKSEFSSRELANDAEQHLKKFLVKPLKGKAISVLKYYRRHLVDKGLIEEIVDDGPADKALVEAGISEARL